MRNPEHKTKIPKDVRIASERKRLETDLANGNFGTLRARVAMILSRYKEARNSDIELQFLYWSIFHSDIYKYGDTVSPEALRKMERLTSLSRMRRKIQNEYELYLADEEVRTERDRLAAVYTEETALDKPMGMPASAVYCDETGKSSKYIGVGGIWFSHSRDAWKLHRYIEEWKQASGINQSEFHFARLSQRNMPNAKEFFAHALKFTSGLGFGFKAVFVERSGLIHSVDDAVRELHYQLLYRGIEHDRSARRTTFPRSISMFKDADPGYDKLHMQRLQDDLTTSLEKRYGEDVIFKDLFTPDSKGSYQIQIADLFVASLNRVLERSDDNTRENVHFRDQMADYVLELLGIAYNGKSFDLANQDYIMIDFLQE